MNLSLQEVDHLKSLDQWSSLYNGSKDYRLRLTSDMKEFDYELDYKSLDFTDAETRKLYRIGRGEQGVLLVRPYTDDICAHWRFVDEPTARKSSDKIYSMFCEI